MKKFNKWAQNIGMNILIKYKLIFFLAIILLVIWAFLGLDKIRMDNSYEAMFEKNEDVNLKNQQFKDIFGNEEFIFVMVEAKNIFNPETLQFIRHLSDDLEANLPFVNSVTSITNMEFIDVIDGDLYVDDLIGEEIPQEKDELDIIKNKLLAKDIYVDRLISLDGKKAGIFIEFEQIPDFVYIPVSEREQTANSVIMQDQIHYAEEIEDNTDYLKIVDPLQLISPALDIIIKNNSNTKYEVSATGEPITDYKINNTIQSETSRTFIITLVIAIILLLIIFRTPAAVIAPVIVIICTTIATFGTLGWLGIPLSSFTIILACLLLIITVSYSIHIVNHFQRNFRLTGKRIEAVRYAYEHATWPCFLTALTTAIGFASFIFVPMIPIRNLGISSAIGVLIGYILVMILIPAILSFGKDRKVDKYFKDEKTDAKPAGRFMRKWADFSLKSVLPTGIISVIIIIVLSIFIFQIDVDNDFIRIFGDGCEFVRDAKHVTNNLGALYSYEILIELPEADMAKEPEVLRALEQLETLINSYDTTKRTMSLNDLVKDINMTMNNNNRWYYTIPETRPLIAQYLLLYDISGGGELDSWVDYNYQLLRLSVQVKQSTIALRECFKEIEVLGNDIFPAGTRISITGSMPIFIKSIGTLIEGQILSICIAFLCISVMMMIVLRSIPVGLIAMIPNVLPVIVVAGLMGIFGITLNMMTIVVAPLLIGIAVDDTVHYFIHFRQEFRKRKSYLEANRETFRKIGWALVFTSVILIIGFSAFAFTSILSILQLAILTSIGITVALSADLLITPVLFVFLKPFGQEQDKTRQKRIVV